MHLELYFKTGISTDNLRSLIEAMATVLAGREIHFVAQSRETLKDMNCARGAFLANWADGDVTYVEEVKSGTGNPKDGYGYEMNYDMRIGDSYRIWLEDAAWDPHPRNLVFRTSGLTLDQFFQLHARLCELVPGDLLQIDCTFYPYPAALNLRQLMELGTREDALRMAAKVKEVGGRSTMEKTNQRIDDILAELGVAD